MVLPMFANFADFWPNHQGHRYGRSDRENIASKWYTERTRYHIELRTVATTEISQRCSYTVINKVFVLYESV